MDRYGSYVCSNVQEEDEMRKEDPLEKKGFQGTFVYSGMGWGDHPFC